jgi:hypothetical protein
VTSAEPDMPSAISSKVYNVKEATPDIIIRESSVNIDEAMFDIYFEQVAAQEIITIARHDTVNGQPIIYQPIKNLPDLAIKYGPQSIIALQNSSKAFFDNFAIRLENYIPNEGEGIGGTTVYIDNDNALVIDLVNLKENEQVEVQILKSGEINNGTIY